MLKPSYLQYIFLFFGIVLFVAVLGWLRELLLR
jgi:hypothetical protein